MVYKLNSDLMKIGIEGQRLFRTKKHGMDMVALELIKNLQKIDRRRPLCEYLLLHSPEAHNDDDQRHPGGAPRMPRCIVCSG